MTPTDYISRDEVMKEFVKMKEGFTENSDYATGIKSGIDACIYRVINTPSWHKDKSLQIREIVERKLLKENNSYDKAYSQCYQEILDGIDSL